MDTFGNYEGFSQILKEQSGKKVTWVHLLTLKKKLRVHVIVDYADTQLSNFAIEFLRENEKFAQLFLPVDMGPRSNLLRKENSRKYRNTVPLRQCWWVRNDLFRIHADPDPAYIN